MRLPLEAHFYLRKRAIKKWHGQIDIIFRDRCGIYGMIDRQGLHEYGISESESFAEHHRRWVYDALRNCQRKRESHWTESIAVGSSSYVEEIKARLGIKAVGRKIETQGGDICILREDPAPYNAVFNTKTEDLRVENCYFWDHF